MNKIVNVRTTVPVRTITPPIFGNVSNVKMSTGDILKCLCFRATVDEVLPDGSTVRLTMKNYAVDHVSSIKSKNTVEEVLDKKDEDKHEDEVKVSDTTGSEKNENQMVEMSNGTNKDETEDDTTPSEDDDETDEDPVDETEDEDEDVSEEESTNDETKAAPTADSNKNQNHKNGKKNKRK